MAPTELPTIRPITTPPKNKSMGRFFLEWILGGIAGLVIGGLILYYFFDLSPATFLPAVIWPLKYR